MEMHKSDAECRGIYTMDAQELLKPLVLDGITFSVEVAFTGLPPADFPKKKVHTAIKGCPPSLCRSREEGEAEAYSWDLGGAKAIFVLFYKQSSQFSLVSQAFIV